LIGKKAIGSGNIRQNKTAGFLDGIYRINKIQTGI